MLRRYISEVQSRLEADGVATASPRAELGTSKAPSAALATPTRLMIGSMPRAHARGTRNTRWDLTVTTRRAQVHAELEELTARFIGKEAALVFGMGYRRA
jgi:hypothetical protein